MLVQLSARFQTAVTSSHQREYMTKLKEGLHVFTNVVKGLYSGKIDLTSMKILQEYRQELLSLFDTATKINHRIDVGGGTRVTKNYMTSLIDLRLKEYETYLKIRAIPGEFGGFLEEFRGTCKCLGGLATSVFLISVQAKKKLFGSCSGELKYRGERAA